MKTKIPEKHHTATIPSTPLLNAVGDFPTLIPFPRITE